MKQVQGKSTIQADCDITRGLKGGDAYRIAIVVASYNHQISQGLLDGCIKGLSECQVTQYRVIEIDGAFELPLVAKHCAKTVDAVICLGAVIKGDTAHFEYVAGECARGLQDVMLQTGKPIIFGVLTTYTEGQALARSLPDALNKGLESAYCAVKMCSVLTQI